MAWNERKGTFISPNLLMSQVISGNSEAFETLYNQYAPFVMGVVMKRIGDIYAAEEVVQETFWRVWDKAHLFQPQRGTFPNWLFGIARNLSVDYFRRGAVRPEPAYHTEDEDIYRIPDPDGNVEEQAELAIKSILVRAALKQLTVAQRAVIEMAFFRGMTRQEIAAATGEPLGTIHTRARRGMQKLRELLKED